MSKKKDFFQKHAKTVEAYLSGERENPMICTTDNIARQLENRYNFIMEKKETVNAAVGLYMFEIQ